MTEEAKTRQALESHYKSKLACLSLLCGYWLLATVSSDPSRFSFVDLFLSGLLLIVVLFVQACLLLLAKRRVALMDALIGFFFACSFFALYVTFAFPFLWILDWYVQAMFFALAWLVAARFFSSFAIGRGWRKLLVGMAGVLFAFQIAVVAYHHLERYLIRHQPPHERNTGTVAMTSSPNVRLVEFTRTPNVYFISFDAMLPETLASELLDIPSLEYERTLEENGFLRFPNYFSEASHTRTAFARLFAFDPQYKYLHEEKLNTGFERSPLREIFRSNGYKIHLFTNVSSLGFQGVGDYLDSYVIANKVFTSCPLLGNRPAYAFFGYCSILYALHARRYLDKNISNEQFVGFMFNDVSQLIKGGEKHFFVAYVKFPDHIDNNHIFPTPEQWESFREQYKQGSAAAAVAMEEIMAFIRENDPDAWVYFFSDHGSIMYRGEVSQEKEVGQRLRVLDNYGGLGAFYPPQACEDYFVPRQWSTTSMISRDIVRCLAGGVDPFVNEVTTYQHVDEGIDVTDHLYE